MNSILTFLYSIIGVALLTFIMEFVMPKGQMQKYIKGTFSILMILVILYPISKIDILNIKIDDDFFINQNIDVDSEYLDIYIDTYFNFAEKSIKKLIEEKGYENVSVEIIGNMSNNEICVSKVIIDISNLVIDKNMAHINKYTDMQNCVMQIIDINAEDIIFNE